MEWEVLEHWGKDASRLERLTGGGANDVWSVQAGGQLAVARLGTAHRPQRHASSTVTSIHGTADRVALIDWDESHVDVPDLDPDVWDIAEQASAAWEAAVCWKDEYAVKRLAQVRVI
jgi:hypothetical protein